jgi:O-glycosyl hydrolase
VELITPDVSGVVHAPSFFDAMTSDPATMAHIQHVGVHDYAGSAGGMDGYVKATTYPDRNLWLTEWSQNATDGWLDNGRAVADEWRFASVMTDALLSLLKGNAAAVLAWDAWDNVHEHCGCSSISRWGQLALDSTAQTYRPKKRFFTNAHVFNFVPPGWVRIDANASEPGVRVVAFTDAASGQVTIVGHNTTATTAALSASLAGLAPIPTLRWYETNASENLVRKPDITVGGTGFNVNVAANSFFTFTTVGSNSTPHV